MPLFQEQSYNLAVAAGSDSKIVEETYGGKKNKPGKHTSQTWIAKLRHMISGPITNQPSSIPETAYRHRRYLVGKVRPFRVAFPEAEAQHGPINILIAHRGQHRGEQFLPSIETPCRPLGEKLQHQYSGSLGKQDMLNMHLDGSTPPSSKDVSMTQKICIEKAQPKDVGEPWHFCQATKQPAISQEKVYLLMAAWKEGWYRRSNEGVPRVYRPPYGKPNPVIPEPLVSASLAPQSRRKIQILLSVDFDAVSGLLGTGVSPQNNIADDSSGFLTRRLSPRLAPLQALQGSRHRFKHNLVHSMESIPSETQQVLNSGAEIACHGYTHEGGAQMSEEFLRSLGFCTVRVLSHRAADRFEEGKGPTVGVDSPSTHRDYEPYFLPEAAPIEPIDYSPRLPATTRTKPFPTPSMSMEKTLVEIYHAAGT
ncbi:hypothetical protein LZ554_001705 [Drepanopeziza brunnea f. sp. 'monogermtubi']|nr:hypothetical protein LZ554_001705 [Drepanopeziza brunnea f. sp. 'monogermtubi']